MSHDYHSYLGLTGRQYPFPLLHSQMQTHGFKGLMPRHKAFLEAYNDMIGAHQNYKKKSPNGLPLKMVVVYPERIYLRLCPTAEGKPELMYCKSI
jgi:hypothetical protein